MLQQKIKKTQWVDPKKNVSQTDGDWQMDGRTGLISQDAFHKNGDLKMWATWKESMKKKEYNQHSSVFKEFKNNDPLQIYVR